jgi:hypothetical protein
MPYRLAAFCSMAAQALRHLSHRHDYETRRHDDHVQRHFALTLCCDYVGSSGNNNEQESPTIPKTCVGIRERNRETHVPPVHKPGDCGSPLSVMPFMVALEQGSRSFHEAVGPQRSQKGEPGHRMGRFGSSAQSRGPVQAIPFNSEYIRDVASRREESFQFGTGKLRRDERSASTYVPWYPRA